LYRTQISRGCYAFAQDLPTIARMVGKRAAILVPVLKPAFKASLFRPLSTQEMSMEQAPNTKFSGLSLPHAFAGIADLGSFTGPMVRFIAAEMENG